MMFSRFMFGATLCRFATKRDYQFLARVGTQSEKLVVLCWFGGFLYLILFKPALMRSASRWKQSKNSNHKPCMGLCYIYGEIFLLHSAGGVNGENPMFLYSFMVNTEGRNYVGLLKKR